MDETRRRWQKLYEDQRADFRYAARQHPIIQRVMALADEFHWPEERMWLAAAMMLLEENRALMQNAHINVRMAPEAARPQSTSLPCSHNRIHHEGSLGLFCSDCGKPMDD